MPFTYWGIRGLGVSLNSIRHLLDAEQIRIVLQKHADGGFRGTSNDVEDYLRDDSAERISYLDSVKLSGKICGAIVSDDKGNLLSSAYDGDEQRFILYEPCYPWDQRKGECTTEESARQYICDFILRFTLPEVTSEQVMKEISFIDEVGSSD